MKKNAFSIILLLLVFVTLTNCSFHQSAENELEQGKRVYLDGVFSENEWTADAKIFSFEESEFVKSRVYLKHDGNNLLLAYENLDIKDTTFLIPEFFIDTKFDKGEIWNENDFWFHVSAQDCYCKGKPKDFSNCRPDYLVWRASPNLPYNGAYEAIGVFEISVPFELLGISLGDTIGVCLSLKLYPHEIILNYPETANADKPISWKEFVIK